MYKLKLALAIGFIACFCACSDSGNDNSAQQPTAPTPYARTAAQQDFIDKAVVEGSPRTFNGMLRLAEGLPPAPGSFDKDLELLNSRGDTADFGLPAFLMILAKYSDSEALDKGQQQLIEDAVINFKFWPDELNEVPGTTDQHNMVSWTENHYILFASGGYIAGQLYPDRVFPASGLTGEEMVAVFKPRILRWLELRYKSGFSEWLSNVYYDEEVPGLMALIELVDDQEIVNKSRMVLDLLMADMALNNFQGNFGATHGRSYTSKMTGRDSTRGIMNLEFGLHEQYLVNPSAIMLAVSQWYSVPEVLRLIANDQSTPMENRQRMGIKLEEAANWGLDPNNIADGMLLMTMEPYTHPLFIETFYAMLNAYQWWDLKDFKPFKDSKSLLDNQAVRTSIAASYEWDLTRNMRPEVNIYTYRTPSYMLSTAQDWRKGFGGDQSSIWQATLGIDAAVFTTHPGSENPKAASPNYWVGSGTLPRAAQVKNVVISLYDVDTRDGLNISHQPLYTHAFLPRAKFDETVKQGNWFFARKGDAYLALWSSDPTADWIPKVDNQGGGGDYDIIAQGEKTIWLCELGDAAAYGDFDSFKIAISTAALTADPDALTISYDSPSQGTIEMGWEGDVLQNGVKVQLDGYERYDNPWSQSAFPAEDISFKHADKYLKLNFDADTRQAN